MLYAKGLRAVFEHFADPVDTLRRIFETEIKILERRIIATVALSPR